MTNLSISLYILVRAADLDIGADSVFEPVDRFAGINRAERPLRRAFTIARERLVKGMSVAIEQVGQRVQIHTLVAKGELTAALFRYLQRFAPGQGHGLLEVWWRDTGRHGVPEHGKMEGSPQTGHHQLRLLLLEQLVVVGVRRRPETELLTPSQYPDSHPQARRPRSVHPQSVPAHVGRLACRNRSAQLWSS